MAQVGKTYKIESKFIPPSSDYTAGDRVILTNNVKPARAAAFGDDFVLRPQYFGGPFLFLQRDFYFGIGCWQRYPYFSSPEDSPDYYQPDLVDMSSMESWVDAEYARFRRYVGYPVHYRQNENLWRFQQYQPNSIGAFYAQDLSPTVGEFDAVITSIAKVMVVQMGTVTTYSRTTSFTIRPGELPRTNLAPTQSFGSSTREGIVPIGFAVLFGFTAAGGGRFVPPDDVWNAYWRHPYLEGVPFGDIEIQLPVGQRGDTNYNGRGYERVATGFQATDIEADVGEENLYLPQPSREHLFQLEHYKADFTPTNPDTGPLRTKNLTRLSATNPEMYVVTDPGHTDSDGIVQTSTPAEPLPATQASTIQITEHKIIPQGLSAIEIADRVDAGRGATVERLAVQSYDGTGRERVSLSAGFELIAGVVTSIDLVRRLVTTGEVLIYTDGDSAPPVYWRIIKATEGRPGQWVLNAIRANRG